MPKQNPWLSLATTVHLVLGCSWPRCLSSGDTHPGQGELGSSSGPRGSEIKQKSANKLKSATRVPALTSSILLFLSLQQRRFPAQEAAWSLPECARKRESLPCSGSKRLPAADLHRSLSARSCSQSVPAGKAGSAPRPSRSSSRWRLAAPCLLELGTAAPRGRGACGQVPGLWLGGAAVWQAAMGMAGTAEPAHRLSTYLL